ncbi:MAG: hypothetical protein WCJ71_09005, partial [Candidatus Omnitrophota bacterium]
MAPKNPFAGFSYPMLEKFNVTVKDIDDKYRLDPEKSGWAITIVDTDPARNSSTRFEVLTFLKKIGAITSFGKSLS